MSVEINNARITKTSLDIERFLTVWLHLDYGGSGQAFGGWVLGGEWGCQFLCKLMETVGVERWEDLPGKHIRAEHDWGKVYAIGHIIEDKWFRPETDLAEYLPKPETPAGGEK